MLAAEVVPLNGFFGGGIYSSLDIDLFIGIIETATEAGGRAAKAGKGGPTVRTEDPFDCVTAEPGPDEEGGTGGGGNGT
jgi:hypothetical protein